MFQGFISYAGNEIANSSRLKAYSNAGLLPAGVTVKDCDECDVLHEVFGDTPYQSPLQDDAPWVDPNNQSSWEFAGLQILDMTGVMGSTRTASTNELMGAGGYASRPRLASRVIGVSALMMGYDSAAIEAGMQWLSAVLKGDDCGGTSECEGSQLCLLTACPTLCDQSTDPLAPMQDYPIASTDPGWIAVDGIYSPGVGQFAPSPGGGYLGAPLQTSYDEFEAIWTVTSVSGPFTVMVGAVDADGNILEQGDPILVGFTQEITFATTAGYGDWRPVIWVEGNPATVELLIRHRPYLDTDSCVDPYLRTYERVTTVDGPHVVEQIGQGCDGAALVKVSWTWHVGNPYIYQQPTELLAGYSSDGNTPPDIIALGVTVTDGGTVTYGETACTVTPPADPPCTDPCCTMLEPPPSIPFPADPCVVPSSDTTPFQRTIAQVPARYVPAQVDGMLNIVIASGAKPKMGVRIRIYPDPLELGFAGNISECDYCSEYNIIYMPGNSAFLIDAAHNRALITCSGNNEDLRPTNALRGEDFSPFFEFPALACGMPYMVVMDVPLIYPKDCPPYYTERAAQGDLRWGMYITPRGE